MTSTVDEGQAAGYTAQERAIFRYDRGDGTTVYGDPLMLDMKLRSHAMQHGGLDKLIDTANAPDPAKADPIAINAAYQATEAIAALTVTAFDLTPFDPQTGRGTTTAMAKALFNAFQGWLEKKNQPIA